MRLLLGIAAALLLTAVVAFVGLFVWLDEDKISDLAQRALADEPGRELSIGAVERSISLVPRITLHDIRLASSADDAPVELFTATRLAFDIDLLSLPFGRVRLERIDALQPALHFPVDKSNQLPAWAPLFQKITRWSRSARWSAGDFTISGLRVDTEREATGSRAELVIDTASGRAPELAALELTVTDALVSLETVMPAQPFDELRIDTLELSRPDGEYPVRLSVDGAADDRPLRFVAHGDNLAAGKLTRPDRLQGELEIGDWRLQIDGELRVQGDPLFAGELHLLDESEQQRELSAGLELLVNDTARPALNGRVHVPSWSVDVAGNEKSGLSPPRVDGYRELGLAALQRLDMNLQLEADRVAFGDVVIEDLAAPLRVADGELNVDTLRLNMLGGEATATLSAVAHPDQSRIAIESELTRIDAAALLETLGVRNDVAAGVEARINIESQGGDVAQWFANASGDVGVVIDDGRLSAALAQLADADLLEMFLSSSDSDETTPIRCGVLELRGKGGIFEARTLVLDTGTVKLIGDGTINLREQRIALQLIPHGKDFNLLSASPPMHIEGSLTDPQARIATGEAIASLLTPIEFGATDAAPCKRLIERTRQHTAATVE